MGFGYFDYAKNIFRPVELESVFLFVTSNCNSRCRTCFYWEELNQGRDLTFGQIERLSRTAPRFHKLWISGGEPFLRKELADIIELFYVNNGVRHVNLPTNGLLSDKLEIVVDALLARCPELVVDLNFSLDGLANTHDAIRGVPNNFERTLAALHMATSRWRGVRRLRRNVVTCITTENHRELVELGLKMLRETDADGHYFEIIRGDPMDAALKRLAPEELRDLHRRLMPLHERYADQLFSHLRFPARALARAFYLGNIRLHFDIHERNHYSRAPWPMRCTAGQTTIVIDHDGHFRSCELRPKLARLQDFNFDLNAALRSQQMKAEIGAIPGAQCWCTHSCWIHTSSKFSPKVLLFHIPWAYLKSRWQEFANTRAHDIEQFRVEEQPSDPGLQSLCMTERLLPRRIASLQPSATDILARLGLLDRVVACTRHCAEVVPHAADGKIVISDSWSVTADEIMGTRPDLVIASVPYQLEALAQILKSGTRLLALAPRCLRDIYGDIAAMASITGVPERGLQVIAEMVGAIEGVRRTAATAVAHSRVFCEEWGKPIIASERWVAELVAAAGGEFIGEPGKQADAERIRAAEPEVIIFAWAGAGDRVPAEKVIAERGWQHTPAARVGRIYVVHDALLNTPSPVLAEGIKTLAWALHPELFAPAQHARPVAVI